MRIREILSLLDLAMLMQQAAVLNLTPSQYAAQLIREGIVRQDAIDRIQEMEQASQLDPETKRKMDEDVERR